MVKLSNWWGIWRCRGDWRPGGGEIQLLLVVMPQSMVAICNDFLGHISNRDHVNTNEGLVRQQMPGFMYI